MTRLAIAVAIGVTALFGSVSDGITGQPIEVVVSILPQQEIIQELGGEEVSVTVLIPPGRSPATLEPSPRLMASVSDADLLLPLGLPFEHTVIARIGPMGWAIFPGLRERDRQSGGWLIQASLSRMQLRPAPPTRRFCHPWCWTCPLMAGSFTRIRQTSQHRKAR